MQQSVRHFLLALQFLTRIPVTGRLAAWVGYSPALLRAAAGHFPGVGWVVGLIAAAVYAGAILFWPPAVAAVLATAATAWVTGGFHEDGLADVADGLGGTRDPARALEIMRDSRVGAFGALALMLALAGKVALLVALAVQGTVVVAAALVAAHVLSRAVPLGVMQRLPHVGGAKSKPLADAVSSRALIAAAVWSLPALALVVAAAGAVKTMVLVAVLWGLTRWLSAWFRHRLGGYTGDCLGAVQQCAELALYLVLAAAWA